MDASETHLSPFEIRLSFDLYIAKLFFMPQIREFPLLSEGLYLVLESIELST